MIFEVSKLDSNNPAKILKKTVCRIEKDNKKIISANEISIGDNIDIWFSDGKAKALITDKEGGISS